jgi:hypothetical protein
MVISAVLNLVDTFLCANGLLTIVISRTLPIQESGAKGGEACLRLLSSRLECLFEGFKKDPSQSASDSNS